MFRYKHIVVFLFAGLMSCGRSERRSQESIENKEETSVDSGFPGEIMPENDPAEEGYIAEQAIVFSNEVPELPAFHENKNHQMLPDPFRSMDALRSFFPGKEYRFQWSQENIDMVVWRCPLCDSVVLTDELNPVSGKFYFPGSAGWDTRALQKIPFAYKGREYLILPFYSAVYEAAAIHTGRFNPPVIGMSLFVKEDTLWRNLGHNSRLAAMGSFGTAEQPHLLWAKDAVLVSHKSANGAAGGPFLGTRLIYAFLKGKWFEALALRDSYCLVDGIFEWDTELSVLDEERGGMPLLRSVMKGNVSTLYDEPWLMDALPGKVKKEAGSRSEYSFEYSVEWQWEKGKYAEKSSSLILNDFISSQP
jgi:hypothetical protein